MTAASAAPPGAPAPMEGHGAYNRHSRVQGSAQARAVALFERTARDVPLAAPPAPLVVADYGVAAGHNSLLPIGAAARILRQRLAPHRAIHVVHNDVPGNDYGALFDTLENDAGSYLRGDAAIFPSAVGRSFFGQVLPENSVTLGWSSWAAQWMSRAPVAIPDHVQVAYSRDEAARAAFASQAAADWLAFLQARRAELCPGGRLVVLLMATDDDGDFGYRGAIGGIHGALDELVAGGVISAAELTAMAIPTYGRSRAELRAPFDDTGRFGALSLESLDIFHAEDRIWSETNDGRDAAAFGARWAAFMRASVGPSLAAALDDARRAGFLDALEAAIARRLAAAPAASVIPLATLVLVKAATPDAA